jgi:hypothetical protein
MAKRMPRPRQPGTGDAAHCYHFTSPQLWHCNLGPKTTRREGPATREHRFAGLFFLALERGLSLPTLSAQHRHSNIRMSRERDEYREERREQPAAEAPNEAFKAFIGGISYQVDDHKLLEGRCPSPLCSPLLRASKKTAQACAPSSL